MWGFFLSVIFAFAVYLDLLPFGNKKPNKFRGTGRLPRIDGANFKGLSVRETTRDPFRNVTIVKTNQLKHPVYVPDSLVPQPSNLSAYIAGDQRNLDIRVPVDVMGRYQNWGGGGYPMLEHDKQVQDLKKQNYMLSDRVNRFSEPVDAYIDREMDRMNEVTDMVTKVFGAAKAATEQQKR